MVTHLAEKLELRRLSARADFCVAFAFCTKYKLESLIMEPNIAPLPRLADSVMKFASRYCLIYY